MAWGVFNRACAATRRWLKRSLSPEASPRTVRSRCGRPRSRSHYGLQTDLLIGYRFAVEAYNHRVDTDDRREGVRAFNEKREPVFQGK